ncbi:MAG TPA: response regulator transcription factor [Pyrinomonadaceae bacterium]|nr:response regulator transcription factor [Pyrinomonadaceae bacterium]
MTGARILIVEDEEHLARGLCFNLEAEGYTVETVGDGEAALERLLDGEANLDAVVLDVMLPGKDGFEVASELRAAGRYIPVLMLTARGRPEDVLRGFEAGADDYLPKPFELAILLARIHGLLRRREWFGRDQAEQTDALSESYSFNGKRVESGALELHARGSVVKLTLMEAELLRYLIRNENRAVSRKEILEDVWNLHEDTDTRAIDNFIVRLRKYVEDDPSKPRHLLTVRGIGYRFTPKPEES